MLALLVGGAEMDGSKDGSAAGIAEDVAGPRRPQLPAEGHSGSYLQVFLADGGVRAVLCIFGLVSC
jgi:hypothetical protein